MPERDDDWLMAPDMVCVCTRRRTAQHSAIVGVPLALDGHRSRCGASLMSTVGNSGRA